MSRRRPPTPSAGAHAPDLPPEVRRGIELAGYYPALVEQVVATAVAGEAVHAHLVHQETTFDAQEVRRHVTVLVVTPTRLVTAHVDDHGPDDLSPTAYASASTEAVPLRAVRSVVLQHVVANPTQHSAGSAPDELSLTIGWGSLTRVDLEPASCADPDCEADHGYTGTMTGDDITVRLSAEAEGEDAVRAAAEFGRALSAATARS